MKTETDLAFDRIERELDLYCMIGNQDHVHIISTMPVSGDVFVYCKTCKKEVKHGHNLNKEDRAYFERNRCRRNNL